MSALPKTEHARVICIVGPTASGKSDIAQDIALHVSGEVVSADSMQIYRGMDIGTGKVPVDQRKVTHHGLDIVDPGQPYSAALFQDYARSCFVDIEGRGKVPILCGGTGFYVRAAIDDYQFPKGEQVGNAIRDHYRAIADSEGAEALWSMLKDVDPESAALIAPADVKRVIRAFELIDDGTSYATQKEKLAHITQAWPAVFLGLHVDPEVLRARIDARVDKMIENGLVNEVNNLIARGFEEAITAPQAIGYKEICAYLRGDCSLEQAAESIKIATHRYAKRQRTWFRKDKRIHWIDATVFDRSRIVTQALDIIENTRESREDKQA